MLEPAHASLSVGKMRLHYLDWGGSNSHRPMLLLHGGLAHAHWWDFLAPLMLDRYRVLALDLRGHGESSWDRAADYGLEAHVSDVLSFIRAMNLEGVTLVGHSFGGQVALEYVLRYPERVSWSASSVTRSSRGRRPLSGAASTAGVH
jgi:pimeloyl-ACP methyl ester carboxylesterase